MDINKNLLKAIEDSMDNKGLGIEVSKDLNLDYFRVDEEVEKENIRIYINAEYMNSYIFLYTFVKMLENNEITITFNDNATDHNINYLKKLSEEM